MLTLTPKLTDFLAKITHTTNVDAALWKLVSEYLDMKSKELDREINKFNQKWGMSFDEFSNACKTGKLSEIKYSYEVEKDFWDWERAITLKRHYQELGIQWM